MAPALAVTLNALGLYAIALVLIVAFAAQLILHELPCLLCLLQRIQFALLAVGPVLAQGSSEAQQRRQEIDSNAQIVLDDLLKQENARDLYGRAVGYAVFTVTKGGFIVSGGGGNGDGVSLERVGVWIEIGSGGLPRIIGAFGRELLALF